MDRWYGQLDQILPWTRRAPIRYKWSGLLEQTQLGFSISEMSFRTWQSVKPWKYKNTCFAHDFLSQSAFLHCIACLSSVMHFSISFRFKETEFFPIEDVPLSFKCSSKETFCSLFGSLFAFSLSAGWTELLFPPGSKWTSDKLFFVFFL